MVSHDGEKGNTRGPSRFFLSSQSWRSVEVETFLALAVSPVVIVVIHLFDGAPCPCGMGASQSVG